jgi:hypothetical protein
MVAAPIMAALNDKQAPTTRQGPGRGTDVEYRGAPLDPERGPGLGCFWLQVIVLAVAVVLTPLSALWNWPVLVTIVLLATTLVLLLFVGQTVIFLLRLVAADRRQDARRRPLRSQSKTVGELEDEAAAPAADGTAPEPGGATDPAGDDADPPVDDADRSQRPG